MKVFGPALITHDGVDLGKTFKGGTYSITEVRKRKAGPIPSYDSFVVGGNGTIKLVELTEPINISGTMLYKDYGTLIFTMPFMSLTFYKAQIFYHNSLDFGTNAQATYDLAFVFVPDAIGRVFAAT